MSESRLLGTYDYRAVNLIVGIREILDFAQGTDIIFERDEDSFTKQIGAEGNVTRSRSSNNAGLLTFSLAQFSASNEYLQNWANIDERTGAGVFPVKCVDKSNPNRELAISHYAWIVNLRTEAMASRPVRASGW